MEKTGTCCSPFLKQCLVTSAVVLNCLSLGGVFGFTAVLFPQLRDGAGPTLSTAQESWLMGFLSLNMLPGNFLAPLLADRWCGRRGAHAVISVILLVAWLYISLASTFTDIMIGRALQGLGYGMLMPVRLVMIGEYSSTKHRGPFITALTLAQSAGILIAHLIGSVLSWQITSIIFSLFSFGALVITMYIPESPSYLATKGRHEECREAFKWLRGRDDDDELERLLEAVSKRIDNEATGIRKLLAILRRKEFIKPIVIMAHCATVNIFAGGLLMASYSTVILGELLGSTNNVAFWMLVLDSQRLVSNILSVYVIANLRRRTVLLWTLALCFSSQIAISIYMYIKVTGAFNFQSIWFPVLLINLQCFNVGIGIMPVVNILGGEVFPLRNRGVASSISIVFMAAAAFSCSKTYPSLLVNLGLGGANLIHSGIMIYCFVVLCFILPETKGKTLQEIEDGFAKYDEVQSNPGVK